VTSNVFLHLCHDSPDHIASCDVRVLVSCSAAGDGTVSSPTFGSTRGLAPSQLTTLHSLFEVTCDSLTPAETEALLKSRHSLDLQLLSSIDVVAVLLDLIMYQYPQLANKAFEVLVRHYSQRQALLTALVDLRVLVDDAEVMQFEEVCVVLLRHHAPSSASLRCVRVCVRPLPRSSFVHLCVALVCPVWRCPHRSVRARLGGAR
jgi:hypothetical protein